MVDSETYIQCVCFLSICPGWLRGPKKTFSTFSVETFFYFFLICNHMNHTVLWLADFTVERLRTKENVVCMCEV